MGTPKKKTAPGMKLVNKGGASKTPNVAAKKAKGGSNTKGSSKRF